MNTSTSEKRGPGRPRKEEGRRRRRTGAQAEGKLGVNPDLLDTNAYVYRWINDEQNGRVATMTRHDDWDLVPNLGEKEDSTDLGDKVSIYVGTHKDGTPKRAYLARKPKTFFDEDKAAEQAELDRQMANLTRGKDAEGRDHDYIPHAGISIRG